MSGGCPEEDTRLVSRFEEHAIEGLKLMEGRAYLTYRVGVELSERRHDSAFRGSFFGVVGGSCDSF